MQTKSNLGGTLNHLREVKAPAESQLTCAFIESNPAASINLTIISVLMEVFASIKTKRGRESDYGES